MSRSVSVGSLGVLLGALWLAPAAAALDADEAIGFERTPPRLAFLDGEVSFFRPGAGDWSPAQQNTALAAGDELYTGRSANLELQVGASAFVRAGEETQLALTSLEPDFLQLRVLEGHLSLDLRGRSPSQTFEIDTPNAAFTIERSGYYRVEVDGETTTFTSRRGGRAIVTTAAGTSAVVAPSEQAIVVGTDAPGVETYSAPELDAWDRWNYARSDDQLDAVSARYVPPGVYGVASLDHHGDWRLVPTYGAVWVPRGVPVGWAPYSTGRWMYDPFYGWTWVDDAPWGWAPYHYGRWVYVSGHWGWCPGRIVARPYYAPALVAFYGSPRLSIGFSFGSPGVGWVALGWGEPLLPWWGPVRFRSAPRWAGWGGPRVVNNVVIQHRTVINVREIEHYQNAKVRGAIVAVERDHFGRRSGGERRFVRARADRVEPLRGNLDLKPDRTSFAASSRRARRPAHDARERGVVAVREPRLDRAPDAVAEPRGRRGAPVREAAAPADRTPTVSRTRIVSPAGTGRRIETSRRPPFGRRGDAERQIAPPSPTLADLRREEQTSGRRDEERAGRPEAGRRGRPRDEAVEGTANAAPERSRERTRTAAPAPGERPQPEPRPAEARPRGRGEVRERGDVRGSRDRAAPASRQISGDRAAPATQRLPGEPASRVFRQRSSGRMPRAQEAAPPAATQPQVEPARRGAGSAREGRGARPRR